MSMTLMSRYDVLVSSSAVQSSRRRRVAIPRRPGTRPSVARTSPSRSLGSLTAIGQRVTGALTRRQPSGAARRGCLAAFDRNVFYFAFMPAREFNLADLFELVADTAPRR